MNERIQEYFLELKKQIQFEKDFEENEFKDFLNNHNPKERVKQGICWYPVSIEILLEETNFFELEIFFESKEDSHRFRKGNYVSIFTENIEYKNEDRINGYIKKIIDNKMILFVETEELPDWIFLGKVGIDKNIDLSSYNETLKSFGILENSKIEEIKYLRDILILEKENYKEKIQYENINSLNQSQNEAIKNSLESKFISIIYGPPGTGKTTTLVSLIEKILETEEQILFSAPSNMAVDLVCQKFANSKLKILRIGNPSKISEENLNFTFEEKMKSHSDYKVLKKYKDDYEILRKKTFKYKRNFNKEAFLEKKENKKELFEFKKTISTLEKSIQDDLISGTRIIFSTLVGVSNSILKNKIFSTLIIDEASQLSESFSWIGISRAKKIILCGDPKQLPAVVKSSESKKLGMEKSLLEKLILSKNSTIPISFLNLQYRMDDKIMQFSNKEFYDSKLETDISILNKKNIDRPKIIFIDTSGFDSEENFHENDESYFNKSEAEILKKFIEINSNFYTENFSIAIISPYSSQIDYLSKLDFPKNISINTIDSFQGSEKDIIFISLVRSNENGEIGFLNELRRMNVAMTRAKIQLVLIGDSSTLYSNQFYNSLIEYIELNGQIISAWDFYE